MAVRTIEELKASVDTFFADNMMRGITPSDFRAYFIDVLDTVDAIEPGTSQPEITGAASTIDTEDLAVNRALISNAAGKVALTQTCLLYTSPSPRDS